MKKENTNVNKKILLVTRTFLDNMCSMEELEEMTLIPKSSCQRYLNDPRIILLLGQDIYDEIQQLLKVKKLEGLSKGGIKSTSNNNYDRDDKGHFAGIKK